MVKTASSGASTGWRVRVTACASGNTPVSGELRIEPLVSVAYPSEPASTQPTTAALKSGRRRNANKRASPPLAIERYSGSRNSQTRSNGATRWTRTIARHTAGASQPIGRRRRRASATLAMVKPTSSTADTTSDTSRFQKPQVRASETGSSALSSARSRGTTKRLATSLSAPETSTTGR